MGCCSSADLISAARSFWAAALCVPLYALMLVLSWHQVGWPADLPHEAVLQAVLFVLGWAAYTVISFEMLERAGYRGPVGLGSSSCGTG